MTNSSLPLEAALLSQATSLRGLAWSLLGDEHAADDVLQDTWLRARGNQPRDGAGSLEGWLRRIATNLASNKRRAKRSRAYHEESAARSEAHAAADEIAIERELMRQVIDAISELGEPYQSVVIMRYYQELAPRLIAKERGVPVATIKSQLHRALEMLRGRLDENCEGDREQWAGVLAASLGRGEHAVRAFSLAGGVAVVASCVLVATAAWWLVPAADEIADAQVAVVAGAALQSDNDEAWALGASGDEQEFAQVDEGSLRVALEQDIEWNSASIPPPYSFSMRVEVVDADDVPVRDAQVLLAPEGQPINVVGEVDSRGVLELNWRGHEPKVNMVFGVKLYGRLDSALRKIEVEAGNRVTMRVPSGHRKAHVNALGSYFLALEDGPERDSLIRESGSPWRPTELPSQGVSHADRNEQTGETTFGWGVELAESELSAPDRIRLGALGYAGGEMPQALHAQDSPERGLEPEAVLRIAGQVTCASGEVAAGAPLGMRGGSSGAQFITSDEGRFECELGVEVLLSLRSDVVLELHAGGGTFGIASKSIHLESAKLPKQVDWNPVLNRGNEVSGTLEFGERLHAYNWMAEVEFERKTGLFVDLNAGSTGQLDLLNLPAGRGRLVHTHRGSWPLAASIQEVWSEPGASLTLNLEESIAELGVIEVIVVQPDGQPGNAEVQLWQVSSGRGVWMDFDSESGRHRRVAIPFGEYRVRVGNGLSGYVDAGVVEVVGTDPVVVGPVQLRPAAKLLFSSNDDEAELGRERIWTLLRSEAGITSVHTRSLAEGDEIHVPAGSYRVVLSSSGNALLPITFEVSPGEELAIDLSLARMGEFVLRASSETSGEFRVLSEDGATEAHRGLLRPDESARFLLPAGDYVLDSHETAQPFSIRAGEQTIL